MSRTGATWLAALAIPIGLLWAQREFRVYDAAEGAASEVALPPDYQNKAELVLGRLMYPSAGRGGGFGGRGGGGGGNWLQGRTNWTIDYPKGDRTFATAIRRLTRVDVRSVEQPVNPEDGDDIFNWPYLHVAMPGAWDLTDEQAAKIRAYLLRGGFMLCDSFFGTDEWEGFERGIKKIFPNRPIEEIRDEDQILSTFYDIHERYQVANFRSMLRDGRTFRADGEIPRWRAIRDDKGRIVVAMTFNSDLGDSWQLADDPRYPEKYSALGIRIGINYLIYTFTH